MLSKGKIHIKVNVCGFLRICLNTICCFGVLSISPVNAKDTFQTIRGQIVEKISQTPIKGASLILQTEEKTQNSTSNEQGDFRFIKVPTGRHLLRVVAIGFKAQNIPVILISGKELILNIELEESISELKEIIVKSSDKTRAINEMSSISSRAFTVEETNRYAGARNDPSRMAQNFAGVGSGNDSRNDIVIRGNAPSGLLWRLDGIDIPNPNHFSTNGSTGGAVGMLNNNALSNSDFMTGAFAAEYSNAISGAFDLKMRKGNNEKREYTAQFGFNGLELGAEGPFSKNGKASYLAYYRFSTLELMQKMGIDFGLAALPRYQDLCFKLNFPVKSGSVSVFGVGGISNILFEASKSRAEDLVSFDNKDLDYQGKMGVIGTTLNKTINNSTFLKLSAGFSYENPRAKIDSVDAFLHPFVYVTDDSKKYKTSFNIHLSKKWGAFLNTKIGIWQDRLDFSYYSRKYDNGNLNQFKDWINTSGNTYLSRFYNEWTVRATPRLSISPGVSLLYLALNDSKSIEPRIGINYEIGIKQKISIGYGMHNKMQDMVNYFVQTPINGTDSYLMTNQKLNFTRAQHFILGYDWTINDNMRIKIETYYQYLDKIPVESKSSSFSLLNWGADYASSLVDSLVNKGSGKNMGLEFTLERFFNKGYYYLLTASYFDSKYKGSDGVERNTAFNNKYVINGLLGKEIYIAKNRVLTTDIKFTCSGGRMYTPIDLEASNRNGKKIFIDTEAYSKQFSAYLRLDLKVGFRFNSEHYSQEWFVSIENVTNQKNIFTQDYNSKTKNIYNVYQLGFFPVGLYRINF